MKKITAHGSVAVDCAGQRRCGRNYRGDYQGREDVAPSSSAWRRNRATPSRNCSTCSGRSKNRSTCLPSSTGRRKKSSTGTSTARIFIKDKRISRGVEFWREHRELLGRGQRKKPACRPKSSSPSSASKPITGHYKGKDPVFDSLVTLAFDYPRRAKFFSPASWKNSFCWRKEQGFEARAAARFLCRRHGHAAVHLVELPRLCRRFRR